MLKQNQKLLLVAVPIFLTLTVVVLAIVFLQPTPAQQTNNTEAQQVRTPTPDLKVQAEKLSIASVSPENGTKNAGIYPTVAVAFNKSIPSAERSSYTIALSSDIQGTTAWSTDGKTLSFTPQNVLVSNQSYTATLSSKGLVYIWSFQVLPAENISEQDILKNIEESDAETKEIYEEFYTNYPWWDNLPIKDDRYFAYFDPDTKKFVGLLYPSRSTAASEESQTNTMKAEILSKLQALGINVNQFGIEWRVTLEP